MKVLMTADALGGVWTYALELSGALERHDIQVVLATMGPYPDRAQRESAAERANLRLHCSNYRLEWMEDPWADVQRAGEWLLNIAQREAVDVVHLNGYVHASLPWSHPVVTVAHSCVCSWWQSVHRSAPPKEWDTYRRKVSDGIDHADRIVAPTHAFLKQFRRLYHPAAPACVIYNARSAGSFTRTQPHKRLPVILACCRVWDEAKSVRVLDVAVRDLPWHAYVAGEAVAPGGRCVKLTSLRCLGSLAPHDIAAWLKRASIFVHPSRYEPFGLAVLEAALAGCVLVLSDLPALRELWEGAAVFVDTERPLPLQRMLRSLIADAERRQYLSEAARGRAREYAPERMGDAYAGLYRRLLSEGRCGEQAIA